MNIEDLRKISFEFRRVSSDMLNSITDDNNVYLIKFREFIDDNKIINELNNALGISFGLD